MELITFLPEQLLLLVPCLWMLGDSLKNMDRVRNEYIPFVLMITGAAFAMMIDSFTAMSFLHGIIASGMAVQLDQSIKQINKLKQNGDE